MIRVAVVTVSDSAVAGQREDRSGPALQHRVRELGWTVATTGVVSDDVSNISGLLSALAGEGEIDSSISSSRLGYSATGRTERPSKTAGKIRFITSRFSST